MNNKTQLVELSREDLCDILDALDSIYIGVAGDELFIKLSKALELMVKNQ